MHIQALRLRAAVLRFIVRCIDGLVDCLGYVAHWLDEQSDRLDREVLAAHRVLNRRRGR